MNLKALAQKHRLLDPQPPQPSDLENASNQRSSNSSDSSGGGTSALLKVISTNVTKENIKILFNEKLNKNIATNPDNYVLTKLTDNTEIPLSATIDDSLRLVELKFLATLEMNENQMLDKKNYKVSIGEGNTYIDLGDDDTITKINDRMVQIYIKQLEDKNNSTIQPYVKKIQSWILQEIDCMIVFFLTLLKVLSQKRFLLKKLN